MASSSIQTLQRKCVVAFRDDRKIKKGELLEPELLQAIEGSRVFIVVFSKDYASSTWCLKELTKIVDLVEQTGRSVLPIFYDVSPSEVRKQSGKFEEAFAEHEKRFKDDLEMVKKWREALNAVANRSGWDVQNRPEHEEIEKNVREVINILHYNQTLSFRDDIIDMHSRLKQLLIYRKAFKSKDITEEYKALTYNLLCDIVVDGKKWPEQRKISGHEFSNKMLRDFGISILKKNAAKLSKIVSKATTSNNMS